MTKKAARPPDEYAEIRKRITKRYAMRGEFYGHLVSFLIFNGVIWYAWVTTDPEVAMPGILLVIFTALWFMGLASHTVSYLLGEAREHAIEKAIERERAYRSGILIEKPKRDLRARLTEDGELIEAIEDDETGDMRAIHG
jgi:hypothetical protein